MAFVGGSGGIEVFTGNTSNSSVSNSKTINTPSSISGLTASFDSARNATTLYAVSAANNALYVLNGATLTLVGTSPSAATTGTYTNPSVSAANPSAPASLEGASVVAVGAINPTTLTQPVYVVGASAGTLTVFQRNTTTNGLTWVQTLQDGVNGVRGLIGSSAAAVSQNGQYLYVTSATGNSLSVIGIQSDGTVVLDQVLRGAPGLDQPNDLAVDTTDGKVYVASQIGIGLGSGGLASFGPSPSGSAASSLAVSYSQIQTLSLTLGNYANDINEIAAGSATSVTLNGGSGTDTISLLDIGSRTNTTVNTGDGSDVVTLNPLMTDSNSLVTINGGSGNDYVELDATGHDNRYTINLGTGNSTAQVEGNGIDSASPVSVNGGTGVDTLLFDSQSKPILAFDSTGKLIPSGQPALPAGQIKINSTNDGTVTYTSIANIPGFVGATVTANPTYTINEGQGITLTLTAMPATNSTLLGASWDLNGDGVFGDALDTLSTPSSTSTTFQATLTWDQLTALGLNGPTPASGVPIAVRILSNSGTVTVRSTLTINSVKPTVTIINTPLPNAPVGVPYTINFSGSEVRNANYGITGWTVKWGDSLNSSTTLPSDATSATFTYTSLGTDTIQVIAQDPYFSSTIAAAPVSVVSNTQAVSLGGPYAINAGNNLVLTASTAGAPSAFHWSLNGNPHFTDTPDSTTTSTTNGVTTIQATFSWATLQRLGIDVGTFNNVLVEAFYPNATNATSAPAALTVAASPPTASFGGSTSIRLGSPGTVTFSNVSSPSTAQTGRGFTYSYDFDDNGTFELANVTSQTETIPPDVLAQPGSYVIHGRVTDGDGQSVGDGLSTDFYTTVTVADAPPSVKVGPLQTASVNAGTPFVLNDLEFSDPGYTTSASSWNFTALINWGDGTPTVPDITTGTVNVTQGSAGVMTVGTVSGSHLYQPGKTYAVQVSVTDADGQSGTTSLTATVGAPSVTVSAGANTQQAVAGSVFNLSQVTFTDNGSPGTDMATINWGDGTPLATVQVDQPATANDLGSVIGSHIYGYPGLHNATVTVTDGAQLSGSVMVPILVADAAPVVTPGLNLLQSPGVPVTLNSTFTDAEFPQGALAESYTALINWGDGTPTAPDLTNGTVQFTPGSSGVLTTGTVQGSHTYATHGSFPVTVTVTESTPGDAGLSGSGTLTAQDVPPTITVGTIPGVYLGTPVVVDASFNDPGYEAGASAASYPTTINWGDGTTSRGNRHPHVEWTGDAVDRDHHR